ncbi:MAG: PilT/PilU family type 4a pilus ATPase [Chthoniobacteraceae bacterium]|nr:PilT/PilU family type 4a pilus ATPase [Chthoniobacteraceae bacterium]
MSEAPTPTPAAQVPPQMPAQGEEIHTLEHVDHYLYVGQQSCVSDVHLCVNMQPIWRRNGELEPIWLKAPVLSAADTERLAMGFLSDLQKRHLAERGDADFAYSNSFGRFRTSVVRHRLGYDMTFRIINTQLRTMEEIGLPDSLKLLTQYHNGLVLVTGSVGCGKSTTLAALVDEINRNRHDHIITLEDPIEYVIPSKGCQVTQREVHTHTKSFAAALRGSLREDPDVIMVGEMRDLETIQLAITAAETGHLVLGTLHTGNAARTLDRVLDVFPTDQREQIRVMVSESLRGVVSQQLVPRMDGHGRSLALEILVNTPAVAATIRDGKTFMLPGIMQTGRKLGMQLMDDSLMALYDKGFISQEEAYTRAEQKQLMRQHFAH